MQVIRAEHAGACYGVRRALDLAYRSLQTGKGVCSLGPLIHNPLVVGDLASQGLAVAEDPEHIETEQVVIRSHGVSPEVYEALEEKGLDIVDATCPHVKRAQQAASALAAECGHVLIIGEDGHPEVEGLKSYVAKCGAYPIVCDRADALPADLPDRIGVVVQTTQTARAVEDVLGELRARGIECTVANTVCQATQHRQRAAMELATQVDAMIIAGGKNSANTVHLFELCRGMCAHTYHIEKLEDIDPSWFDGIDTVGVSAGASTPEAQLAEVEEYLRALG